MLKDRRFAQEYSSQLRQVDAVAKALSGFEAVELVYQRAKSVSLGAKRPTIFLGCNPAESIANPLGNIRLLEEFHSLAMRCLCKYGPFDFGKRCRILIINVDSAMRFGQQDGV